MRLGCDGKMNIRPQNGSRTFRYDRVWLVCEATEWFVLVAVVTVL